MECVCVGGVLACPPPPHSGLCSVGVYARRVGQDNRANVYLFLSADCTALTSSNLETKGLSENTPGILGRVECRIHALIGRNDLSVHLEGMDDLNISDPG